MNYRNYVENLTIKNSGEILENECAEPWKGFRELILVDKIVECEDIISFYFKSKDGKKLIKHKAGQFLPFKIKTEDKTYKDVMRTYSLSMNPNEYIYRISVKRVQGGLISNYLHDTLQIGDTIEAMIPMGVFTLKENKANKPRVLISGGIGITPLLSMAYVGMGTQVEKYFIQAAQNSNVQPFAKDINKLTELDNLKSYVFFDKPLTEDKIGINYDFNGFITKEWIENYLPLDADFYFCGPPPFMKGLYRSLLDLGVNKENINFEFFGDPQSLE